MTIASPLSWFSACWDFWSWRAHHAQHFSVTRYKRSLIWSWLVVEVKSLYVSQRIHNTSARKEENREKLKKRGKFRKYKRKGQGKEIKRLTIKLTTRCRMPDWLNSAEKKRKVQLLMDPWKMPLRRWEPDWLSDAETITLWWISADYGPKKYIAGNKQNKSPATNKI